MLVAIQPDDYSAPDKSPGSDASSPKWANLLEKAGHKVRWVDVRRHDVIDQLHGCQGFMWRWAHFDGMSRIARRLLPVIEHELKLIVYPDQNTCWHYDDKIAQAYLLKAAGIPMPETWVWFDRQQAIEWLATAEFPLILKLATGAGSTNVVLVRNATEANWWTDQLFRRRLTSLEAILTEPLCWHRRPRAALRTLAKGTRPEIWDNGYESQSGYVLFQEFLPDNDFDTRVTIIGDRAFAFRRFNRTGDFRASGSGIISFDKEQIDERFLRLAFQVTKRLHSQSCAIDGLYRRGECVVGEISYTYVSSAVHSCPGHWELRGDPSSGDLVWCEGQMRPEEAQIQDYLRRFDSDPAASHNRIGNSCASHS